jgi:hypothetical protein
MRHLVPPVHGGLLRKQPGNPTHVGIDTGIDLVMSPSMADSDTDPAQDVSSPKLPQGSPNSIQVFSALCKRIVVLSMSLSDSSNGNVFPEDIVSPGETRMAGGDDTCYVRGVKAPNINHFSAGVLPRSAGTPWIWRLKSRACSRTQRRQKVRGSRCALRAGSC